MSIKVQSYVWEHSKADGSALLLLLAIADHAHDNGDGAYPSVATLAAKCRQTERNTQFLLRKLENMGEIVIRYQDGPHGCNVYQIPIVGGEKISPPLKSSADGVKSSADGVKSSADGVKSSAETIRQFSPEPSLESSKETAAAIVEKQPTQDTPNIFKLYENLGLALNPTIAEQLTEAEKEYPPDWIAEAFKRAAAANVRRWNYVEGILKRWQAAGSMDYPERAEQFIRPRENVPIVNMQAVVLQ